ncbi:MAG: alpha/beta hydrolase [Sneathiella sp.]|uniref:alpha/beta hydrolase n=1 Tax=Sneathiella sp. TaxID=1964365 RepID=UPI003001BB27
MAEPEHIKLPKGIRSRYVDNVNGLTMHVLEAGYFEPARPCILLLHGFPELAYSWRKVMLGLAEQGFHVLAPDQRGYGRTTGWATDYDTDLRPFYMLNLVQDAAAIVGAVGRKSVAAVVGHDFGSPVAAYCALVRPEIFRSVILMSAPFDGPPSLAPPAEPNMFALLAALSPAKKHYQHYYCARETNDDMVNPKGGLSNFLRTYFYVKSADWAGNEPFMLRAWSPEELIKMPSYYIMNLQDDMPKAISAFTPTLNEVENCNWLTPEELDFYVQEFRRTGFQGGLNWYRSRFLADHQRELSKFSGRTIDVPSCFIGGEQDWGVFQEPDGLQKMQNVVCSDMKFAELIPDGGHWVQQEKTDEVIALMLNFLRNCRV